MFDENYLLNIFKFTKSKYKIEVIKFIEITLKLKYSTFGLHSVINYQKFIIQNIKFYKFIDSYILY
jgi:hypothetical protein